MIRDKYTYLPVSRQRKYQLRKRDAGKCIICGAEATTSKFCTIHAKQASEIEKNLQKKSKGVDKTESV
jgi:hypothetical protein